jgi:hypothetical protein
MHYQCELEEGTHLEICNEGDKTVVRFSTRESGQRQSQGKTFQTGKWKKTPAVFRVDEDIVVWAETSEGRRFLRVHEREIEMFPDEPDLTGAVEITLRKSSDPATWKPMETMKP